MVFKCQEDSFLKEFTSKVVTCEKTKEPIIEYGKTSKFEGYAVTLENTILFPAGGGQPHDIGRLNNVEVLQVLRKGEEAVHFTQEPLEVGSTVTQELDWERRFDHMQQHSGQHLLSAILEQEHNLRTSSWWLGAEECHVELQLAGSGTSALQAAQAALQAAQAALQAAEARCNELVRQARPVRVRMCRKGDQALDEVRTRTRGLPADCADGLRVVCIEGVDENMCCGTHVSNLSQLQVVKLLGCEAGKRGGASLRFVVGGRALRRLQRALDTERALTELLNQLQVVKLLGCEAGKRGGASLRFVVGGRALRRLQRALDTERALTELLNNEPKKHVELVQKLQKNLKISNKSLQTVLAELAALEVERARRGRVKFLLLCKKEATPEFNRITELLKCKGAFKNGKYQGKAGDLGGFNKCNKLLKDYFNNLS